MAKDGASASVKRLINNKIAFTMMYEYEEASKDGAYFLVNYSCAGLSFGMYSIKAGISD